MTATLKSKKKKHHTVAHMKASMAQMEAVKPKNLSMPSEYQGPLNTPAAKAACIENLTKEVAGNGLRVDPAGEKRLIERSCTFKGGFAPGGG